MVVVVFLWDYRFLPQKDTDVDCEQHLRCCQNRQVCGDLPCELADWLRLAQVEQAGGDSVHPSRIGAVQIFIGCVCSLLHVPGVSGTHNAFAGDTQRGGPRPYRPA